MTRHACMKWDEIKSAHFGFKWCFLCSGGLNMMIQDQIIQKKTIKNQKTKKKQQKTNTWFLNIYAFLKAIDSTCCSRSVRLGKFGINCIILLFSLLRAFGPSPLCCVHTSARVRIAALYSIAKSLQNQQMAQDDIYLKRTNCWHSCLT